MKILIAEDDLVTSRVLEKRLLKWGYNVSVARDGEEAWKMVQDEYSPQMVILDWMMPGMSGLEVCKKIRELDREPYTYIIFLTTRAQTDDIVQGLEAGADDYVIKPFDSHELKVRIRVGQRILNLQTELIAARETLRIQATHDSLTGLWNHSEILNILESELERGKRQNTSVSVIMADLDNFKQINDTYGHQNGDTVICEVSRRILSVLRPYDSIGRYGGEEFLLVLPGCNEAGAYNTAERLRKSISFTGINISSGKILTTISLGISTREWSSELLGEELVRRADEALYEAKNSGRNCVKCFTGNKEYPAKSC